MTAIEDARAYVAKFDEYVEAGAPVSAGPVGVAIAHVRALIAEHERLTAEMHQRELHHFETEEAIADILAVATKDHSQSWLADIQAIEAVARKALKPEHERLTTPPTDDEREALAEILLAWSGPWLDGHRPPLIDLLTRAGFRRQPPITDAQVQAARESLYRQGNRYPSMEDMRAALEAAEAAR